MSNCNSLNTCVPTALARQQKTYSSEALVKSLREAAERQMPGCRKALSDLVREPAFARRSAGEREAILTTFLRKSGKPSFLAGVKSLLTQAGSVYSSLNPCEQQIVLEGLARSKSPENTARQYQDILTDQPFAKASREARAVVLSRPDYYGPRTMNRLVRNADTRLPNDEAFAKNISDYRAGLRQRFKHQSARNHLEQVVTNRTKLRSYFLERWYNPAVGDKSKTVGEYYRMLPGSCWIAKLETARRDWSAFAAREVIEHGTRVDTLPWGHRPLCDR